MSEWETMWEVVHVVVTSLLGGKGEPWIDELHVGIS